MGGVLWRWATVYLEPEDALLGPSYECLKKDPICTVNGIKYFDDILSTEEIKGIVAKVAISSGHTSELKFSIM